ncbi:MAG: hypothetical protein J6S89_10930 [Paludibacteraceae bacterium]|nr:hypothetical protein [Paludibacteraceae bacterium]
MRNKSIISYFAPVGNILLIIAVIAEMIFFPSIDNLLGCGMTIISWILFTNIVLKKAIIHKHFFAWLMLLSMSLYRILPLFATLLERKPISYGFNNSLDTFIGETFLYIISLLAFLLAIRRRHFNTKVHVWLNKIDYYDTIPDLALWILGFIGLFAQIFVLRTNVQIGDIFGKFVSAFTFFQNAPILLFFPCLYKKNCNIPFKNNYFLWLYFIGLVIVNFATNSRHAVLVPFGTFTLLFILVYIINPRRASALFSKYIAISLLSLFFIIPFLSDISIAILAVRNYRTESSPVEILKRTLVVYMDSEQMESLYREKEALNKRGDSDDYKDEWTENYVNNFALNRYCNIRITDATLYYKNIIGNANSKMLGFFKESVLKLLPSPILKALGIKVDKSKTYSQGDYLYYLATGNYSALGTSRVTSHLADGLATFGFFYFPIQFILFWICFLILDCFSVFTKSGMRYSVFGLISIFTFFGMFRNANGCFGELSYILRDFPQFILISWIGLKISTAIAKELRFLSR